jgi:hypothetical protein
MVPARRAKVNARLGLGHRPDPDLVLGNGTFTLFAVGPAGLGLLRKRSKVAKQLYVSENDKNTKVSREQDGREGTVE